MRPYLLLTLCVCSFLLTSQTNYPQDYFRAPVDIPLRLSGTFGELRTNHFHSGIDIKTTGSKGLPILAIAEGSIVRIKISPYGFGKALYLRHPNGYTSVYAHLQGFNDTLEAYLKERQEALQQNEVDLYPPAGTFQFEKGDVIAYSGNSGGSGGPHLHFEIRDSRTEKIINPLLFGFDVADDRYPELSDLNVYEFDKEELISSKEYRILHDGKGKYHVAGSGVIEVFDAPAFGIEAIDRLDGAYNPNGVYSIKMFLNDKLEYHFRMNTFAFTETRYINSHMDFAQKQCCNKKINKLYLDPNNKLSVYEVGQKMNLPDLQVDSAVAVSIQVSDVQGNTSQLDFKVKRVKNPVPQPANVDKVDLPVFAYRQSNFYLKDNLELIMPAGALYRDIYFEHHLEEACDECLSEIHQVGASVIPVQRYYTLRIKPQTLPSGINRDKLCIVSLEEGKIVDYEGGTFKDGVVEARTRQFGQFAVAIDSTAPSIEAGNFRNGSTISAQTKFLKLKVSDKLSGVEHYNAWLGSAWVRLYYDAKNDTMIIRESDLPDTAGEQALKLVVEDDKGNKATEIFKIIRP